MAGMDLNGPFFQEHELHSRRRSRNMWIAGVLGAFVVLVFAITIVKLSSGHMLEAFDHAIRPSLLD